MYINCKTNFSLRYGTLTVDELVSAAAENGVGSVALTNINSTCDTWTFVRACMAQKVRPITGMEVRNSETVLYVLLAANNKGFSWINRFLSFHLQNNHPFPEQLPIDSFYAGSEHIFVVHPFSKKLPADLLRNEFIGVATWEVNKLFGFNLHQLKSKFVVCHPVTFGNNQKTRYNTHKLLRAIDTNSLLSKLPLTSLASPNEYFISPSQVLDAFKQYAFIITNTYKLMESCTIAMEYGSDKTKKCFSGDIGRDREMMKELTEEGLRSRYGENPLAKERVDKELELINKLGLNAYFLIAWDIVRFAKHKGFFYVGRGSGANSSVAYCLHITDVDPIELDLDFENSFAPPRISRPDFNIDFSWLDRDQVIDYIFKRYGDDHVAMLGSYATFQYSATIRELGKVFGLAKQEIDELGAKGRYYGPSRLLQQVEYDKQDHLHRLIERYSSLINGFPHHHSPHTGGILISEEPIYDYTATLLPQNNFVTSQIDMHTAETLGFHKLDILSQRGLGHIKETIRLVKDNKNEIVDIAQIEKIKADPLVRDQLRQGNTTGCVYIESPGMRQLLRKLNCDNFHGLVAASSIIRPGVASSGMMKEYVRRFHDATTMSHLHPLLLELLQDSFGVMIYQEDVVRVAEYFGGLDLAEADTLGSLLNGKYRKDSRFEIIRAKIFSNCNARGYANKLTEEVWRQIESFAGYSFSKAHSASYAVESFQDLYLKTRYPMEFMVAVINNFGGFYPTSLYFYELIKIGASVHLPCANQSNYLTQIHGRDVYVGLVHIKELGKDVALQIIDERARHGPYMQLQDMVERTAVTLEQLNMLISIGAFRFTGKNKKQLLWEANFLRKKGRQHLPSRNSLFLDKPIDFPLPELSNDPVQDLYDEMEILGFPLRNPFDLADVDYSQYPPASSIPQHAGKSVTLVGYFITDKLVPTKSGQPMSFGVFIDPHLDWIDTIHYPEALRQYPLQGKGFYRLTGNVTEDLGFYSIEVKQMKKIGYKERKFALI